jgi:hypothetical protein
MISKARIPQLVRVGNGRVKAVGPCSMSGEKYSTREFSEGGYMSWILQEDLIQNLLPELNSDDREFLITGISPKSWDVLMDEEE